MNGKLVLFLGAATIICWVSAAPPVSTPAGAALTGSWNIAVTLPNQPGPVLAMATATSDGTVVQTGAVPHVSTGHGIWTRSGNRRFVIQSQYFRFDADGNPVGTSVTVTTAELNKSGDQATGSYENTLYDLQGNQVGGFAGPMTATRMTFAAP